MATPKKGSKPIKITLTEVQISDIISQTARSRKGLKAESLEDRIAPSMIGAPIDPSMVPLPGEPTDPSVETGLDDPTTTYDPFVPPTDPLNPPLPGVPLPDAFDDPTTAPTFPGGMTPQFPGGFGAQYGPGAPAPSGFVAPLPGGEPVSPFVGAGATSGNLGGTFGGAFGEVFEPAPIGPTDPNLPGALPNPDAPVGPELPTGQLGDAPLPEGPHGEDPAASPLAPPTETPTNDGPTHDELQTHRQNILRQLRGQ